jgi:hypothetical protein
MENLMPVKVVMRKRQAIQFTLPACSIEENLIYGHLFECIYPLNGPIAEPDKKGF